MTSLSVWIDELIERSSLGTPAARELRRRTGDDEVARVQRLVQDIEASGEKAREFGGWAHTALDEDHREDRSSR
jgi:hypothetical protein